MGRNALVEQAFSVAWVLPVALVVCLGTWLVLCDLRSRVLEFPAAALGSAADVAMVLIALPVFFLVTSPVDDKPPYRVRLSPGSEIGQSLVGDMPSIQLVGNILLFLPLFALAPLRIRRLRGLGRVWLAGVVVSASVELTQYLLPFGRVASIDDVLLNSTGALLGALLTRRLWSTHRHHWFAQLVAATERSAPRRYRRAVLVERS